MTATSLNTETPAPATSRRGWGRIATAASFAILPILLLLGWHWYATTHPSQLASPIDVAVQLWRWIGLGELGLGSYYEASWPETIGASLARVLIGFLIASVLGIIVGMVIGLSKVGARVFDPTVQVLRPIPMTAWLPLSIAFFGLTNSASIFLIALGAFYPVVVNTTTGVRRVNIGLIRAAQVLGASRGKVLLRVIVPAALPSIFDGLRVALGLSWMLVILAEMFAVRTGLGFVLWTAFGVQRTATMMSAMITIGVVGFLCDRLLVWVRGRLLGWSVGQTVGV